MKPILNIAFAFFTSAFWCHCISCDELPQGPNVGKWTCTCASKNPEMENAAFGTNCSTACDCRQDAIGGQHGSTWTCSCAPDEALVTWRNFHSTSCFTTCNCTSGSLSTSDVEGKHSSNKVAVYIFLLFGAFATIVFLASIACCIYRKDRCQVQKSIFSSDKDTSFNSAANLINHRSASLPQLHVPHLNPVIGFIHKAPFMFHGKKTMIPGVIVRFSYFELEQATKNFSNSTLIGSGGSSSVYCGHLKDGRVVAVKRLKSQGGLDVDTEFLSEIELISRLNHRHVVRLLGYCSEFQGRHVERLLVFEYMPNGNLRDCLDMSHGEEPLDWGTRVCIALGVARGLEYLHEAAAPRILHRDVKSTNILLDEKWRAKITDLGMAKCLIHDDHPSCSSSPARMLGTFGYFAPECAILGKASLKSDVFSFGVVILELISGRPPISRSCKKGEESLVIWATPFLHDSKRLVSQLADPLLKGSFPEEEMQIMGYLARECLQMDPNIRPSMSEVTQILSTITPDRFHRINFPINLYQSPMSHSVKSVSVDVQRPEQQSYMVCSGGLKCDENGKWQTRCSLPLSIDRNLCEKSRKGADTMLSMNYIERLLILTSKAQSQQALEDESVDLTEPRFESFYGADV